MIDALLVTADGETFRGKAPRAGLAAGEAVFNTSMAGYQEILTDPSYTGQIVVMTSPHIGNYGVDASDAQSAAPAAAGLVVRSLSRRPSGNRGGLLAYLDEHAIPTVTDLDTRRLTRHLRERGAMGVAVGTGHQEGELRAIAQAVPPMSGRDLATRVTTPEPFEVPAVGRHRGRVVALDLGIKRDIVARLAGAGLSLWVIPLSTTSEEILAMDPHGLFLSNGPGDPEPLTGPVATVRSLLGRLPIFGICLGHQVLGLALGARTFKLPFGHHGGNHPVRRLEDGRVEVTAHNHGFAVQLPTGEATSGELEAGPYGPVRPTHVNLNDGTLEGLACEGAAAFSLQYHPEAAPGPHDGLGYFDRFVHVMERFR